MNQIQQDKAINELREQIRNLQMAIVVDTTPTGGSLDAVREDLVKNNAFLQSEINDGARVCHCGDASYPHVHVRGRFIIDSDLKTKFRT